VPAEPVAQAMVKLAGADSLEAQERRIGYRLRESEALRKPRSWRRSLRSAAEGAPNTIAGAQWRA
jgi:hypothetical protein